MDARKTELTYQDIYRSLRSYDAKKGVLRQYWGDHDEIKKLKPFDVNVATPLTPEKTFQIISIIVQDNSEPGSATFLALEPLEKKLKPLIEAATLLRTHKLLTFLNLEMMKVRIKKRFSLEAAISALTHSQQQDKPLTDKWNVPAAVLDLLCDYNLNAFEAIEIYYVLTAKKIYSRQTLTDVIEFIHNINRNSTAFIQAIGDLGDYNTDENRKTILKSTQIEPRQVASVICTLQRADIQDQKLLNAVLTRPDAYQSYAAALVKLKNNRALNEANCAVLAALNSDKSFDAAAEALIIITTNSTLNTQENRDFILISKNPVKFSKACQALIKADIYIENRKHIVADLGSEHFRLNDCIIKLAKLDYLTADIFDKLLLHIEKLSTVGGFNKIPEHAFNDQFFTRFINLLAHPAEDIAIFYEKYAAVNTSNAKSSLFSTSTNQPRSIYPHNDNNFLTNTSQGNHV